MNQYQAFDIIKQLYYPTESFSDDEDALKKFASAEKGIGTPIEFPDRISNVNGVHSYKIISSKDINFNNVLLPNSIISEANWGSFDEKRRWPSGYPVYVNDVYELMNVVDYLLCATEDLWDEINKLKYDNTTLTNLWFINNLDNPINSINQISSAQFTKKSNYAVLLDPKNYFTTLPVETMENFGIATQFFDENHDDYPILRRVTVLNNNRNGILGDITYEDHNNYYKTQNENVNGIIVLIYGYKIGTDLHFYPMYNIDNFFKSTQDDVNNYNNLIDFIQMKLKYDVYFRINDDQSTNSKFVKVYIDFLYYNWEEVGHPYILYFIDDNNKRQIIYIHTEDETGNYSVQKISTDLLKYSEYINNFYNVADNTSNINLFGAELDVYSVSEGQQYPYLYHISDTGKINLFVQTPNTMNFTLIQSTLQIPYFKNTNSLTANIKILENNKTIILANDREQINGLLYCPKRYNIPDNTNVAIDVNGIFLNNNDLIKYDDEYIDVLIPGDENNFYVYTDDEAQKYYYFNGLDNNGKRRFEQFQTAAALNAFFVSNNSNSITINNIDNVKSAHVYMKNDEAYKLKYKITTNSLINQINDYSIVVDQAEEIENSISVSSNANTYTINLNYNLPAQLEQIKFDLNLYVEETSKVQSTELNLPISLNKIHQPCIQFISKELMEQEIKDYSIYLAYTFGDRPDSNLIQYKYTNMVPSNGMPNTFLIYGEGNTKTNQNVIQGNDDNDKFNTFQDLYTYVIERKYNNFEKKQYDNLLVRSDILANIDENRRYLDLVNDNSLEDSFDKQYTYDNSIEYMRDLIISYHPNNTILNIIGGGVFDNFLQKISTHFVNYVDRQALAYFDNITYSPVPGESKYITFKSIFNINGLGFNYRLHGGDSYLYINKEGSGMGGHTNITDLPFDNQYDLLCNGCTNTEDNIIKFMEISVTDNDNQLTDITVSGEDADEIGLMLDTNVFDIYSLSYEAIVQKDNYRLNNNINKTLEITRFNSNLYLTTYYTPITYINIKNSTFYPDLEILPSEQQYDLTDENVINNQYSRYVEYWNSDYNTNGNVDEITKYKPITMSIKLNENLSNNTPFFYASNEAKLKFNIRRINPSIIDDTSNSKYNPQGVKVNLAINQRYYLVDFIKVNATNKVLNSIGSYPIYNITTGKFDIHEFFNNNIDERSDIYPKPIFKTNNYKYELSKCAKLNKLHFKDAKFNSHDLNSNIIDHNVLYYFDTNINNLINLLSGDDINPLFSDSGDGLKLILSDGVIYGSKNYLNLDVSSGPEISIKFIHRTKPTYLSENIIIGENNDVITNKGDINWDGTFEYDKVIDNSDTITARFRHYQFYSLSQIMPSDISHELFEVPDFSEINNIYIYNDNDSSIKPLASYQLLINGISNTSIFESYYQILLDAFINNKIYERVS